MDGNSKPNGEVRPSRRGIRGLPLWGKAGAGIALLAAALALVAALFPWDWLRGALNDYVSARAGRRFEITRKLDVKLGLTTRIVAEGIEFANPPWAKDPMLVSAAGAEIDVDALALLAGRLELPLVRLFKPRLGLEIDAGGRKSWAMGNGEGEVPRVESLAVDEGTARFVSAAQGADIEIAFGLDGGADAKMPLTFKARGMWRREPFEAIGRSGDALRLGAPSKEPYAMEFLASAARSKLSAKGTLTSLAPIEGVDARMTIQGADLADLYKLVGVVLPETPPYEVTAQVSSRGPSWTVDAIAGKIGSSDLSGKLTLDRSGSAPRLGGAVSSKALNFDDLGPLVGLPSKRAAAAAPAGARALAAKQPAGARARPEPPAGKVLPTAELDRGRLRAMDADVRYAAARVVNARQLPLDSLSLRARLDAGVMTLDELRLGVAGGELAGRVRVDGNSNPAAVEAKLDARSMDLKRLLPATARVAQASFGKVHGEVDLKGRGNSVARMLATSSGNVALVMGKGRVGSLLVEFAELDGVGVLQNLMSPGQTTELRCAAAAFDVRDGLMTSRRVVVDASDAVFEGAGTVSLAAETLDLSAMAYPKSAGLLSFRAPLRVTGSFERPSAGVDKAALAGKAGLFAALSLVNPLLGLATTFQQGSGRDADCPALLRETRAPAAAARAAAAGVPAPAKPAAPGAASKGAMSASEMERERARRIEDLPRKRDEEARKKATEAGR